ncbi:GNAT family N-acetyltransferase [Spirosoma taeanense]|uniref:GNAT family N-acetyltransferase n=1 Tax=Spirosoma taeanense TaxID=2735870 RepID=A0A6M5Y3S7_9BACT|nr:GNAT family N-acetyltransferase [Spirosoma taeanense]QJW89207.1 GNAT family N-acetyltransferase [Spirosoma taeanense]
MLPITTPRLLLLPPDQPIYEALFAGSAQLGHHLNISVPEVLSEFDIETFRYAFDRFQEDASEAPWWLYLFIHRQDRALAGVGGYKGKPDEQGMVEIGYEIYPNYRLQGLATEAADALIKRAFEHPAVRIVQAHTLAEENPSVRVLKRCGMSFTDAFDSPDDGPIWQWQIRRP